MKYWIWTWNVASVFIIRGYIEPMEVHYPGLRDWRDTSRSWRNLSEVCGNIGFPVPTSEHPKLKEISEEEATMRMFEQ